MARVYATESQDRFFSLPDGVDLPAGPLVLRSLSGARLDVDPAAVAPFEIDEAEAKARVKEEIAGFAQKTAGVLSGLGAVLRSVGAHRPGPRPSPPTAPGVLAGALGVDEDELRNDPDAVVTGFKKLLDGLEATVRDALKDTPEAREKTKERLEAFVGAFGEGAPDAETLERLLGGLRDTLADPELEARIRNASEALREATARLRDEGRALIDELDGEG